MQNRHIIFINIFFCFLFLVISPGCRGLKSENEKLKEEIIDMNTENDKLRKELNSLKTYNSNMHMRLAQLNLEIASLQNEIQSLQRDLDSYKTLAKAADRKNKRI
jgi:uncharacterized coiled-coil DUF342 family protein